MRTLPGFSTAIIIGLAATATNAQDAGQWAGFYGGLQFTYGEGHQSYPSSNEYDIEGEAYGLFAGYMLSNGAWVYGGELSYAKADYYELHPNGFPLENFRFNHTLDLKARAGYAFSRALIYGVLGYGFSEWEEGSADPGDLHDVDGAIFGAGVEFLVSDRVFVGGEILQRGMDGDYPFDADLTTISLRAGMTF